MKHYDKLIFVDYDGTITKQDTVVKSINLFMDPKEANEIAAEIYDGKITLSQAVHRCFDGRNVDLVAKMVDNIRDVSIREGFEEFLNRMQELKIPVILLSGGLEPLIMSKIGHLQEEFLEMYYGRIETKGEKFKITSEFDDGIQLLNKPKIMELYSSDMKIIIGDGLTDIGMALEADVAFARGQLVDLLEKKKVSYMPWENFFDIIEKVEGL